MKFSSTEFCKVFESINPDAYASGTTTEGETVDTLGYEEALIIVNCGDFAASATLAITVEEDSDSAMGSTANIASATMSLVDATDDNTVQVGRINLTNPNRERYLRVQGVTAVDAVDYGAIVVLLGSTTLPVSQQQTVQFSV